MVHLYLPRDADEIHEVHAPPETLEVPFVTSGETVLVVDDEPTLRMLVTDVLKDHGYTTLEAENALVGLDMVGPAHASTCCSAMSDCRVA